MSTRYLTCQAVADALLFLYTAAILSPTFFLS
jgi:hypothetical protein